MADDGTSPKLTAGLDDVKRLVLGEEVVAFLGAGVSIPPSRRWVELVESIAKACGVLLNGRSLLAVIDECIDKDEVACNALMRDEFAKHRASTRTLLGYLLRLPFRAILTTNFDPWLQQQNRKEDFKEVLVYPNLKRADGIDERIYYLHGMFDSESLKSSVRNVVFGAASFERAYGEVSLLPGLLLEVFTYCNVLFVGFDPTEEHVALALRRSVATRRDIWSESSVAAPKRYLLRPTASATNEVDFAGYVEEAAKLSALKITLCEYDPEASDHRGLERLFNSWVQQGDSMKRPAPIAGGYSMGSD